jgi:hypothetical protein
MAKDKEKKKVSKSVSYEVEVNAPGFNTYEGTIVSMDETGVVINRKKPRSSSRIIEFIAFENLVAVNGSVGGEGEVVCLNQAADAYYAEGTISPANVKGFVKVEGEDGVTLVNTKFITAQTIVK